MGIFYTLLSWRPKFGHALAVGLFLISSPFASHSDQVLIGVSRAPANYVPNDDVIVVPVDAEMTFYEKHFLNDVKFKDRSQIQQQIKIWQENELMAQQYGLDTSSAGSLYYVPSNDEKWKWVQRSYFRYLKRKGEDPFKQEGQDIVRDWTANDEVNSIDEMEATFRATTRKSAAGGTLPGSLKERKVGKTEKFRFHFQPRLEQGLVILRMTGPIVDARAWVAANGETEINVEKRYATGTRFFINYFVHEQRYLSAIDQNLIGSTLRARFTSTWDPKQTAPEFANERRYQLLYGQEF